MFEIKKRDAAGRLCTFHTRHGTLTTPALMPVINPHQMILTPREIQKIGGECLITNSYIIQQDQHLRDDALQRGLHKLLDFDGPIMTDSGSFQSYLYDIPIDPLQIVEFQRDIGSDIGTIGDIIIPPDATLEETRQGIKETLKRGKKSVAAKGEMLLAGTIQGSTYPALREKCARDMGNLEMDFHPIGGVVPLMEAQRYADIARIIIASKKGLPPSRPVHLFGAGHPLIFPLAVALGCDFFDSAAYAKYAKDDRLLFSTQTKKLEDVEELPCPCDICRKHTPRDLQEMTDEERTKKIATHNLFQTFAEIKQVREALREGSLWELVERRAATNPYLWDAMEIVRKEVRWLERSEPIVKKKAFFYTGGYSLSRPLVYRYHTRLLDRYIPPSPILKVIPETHKPYSKFYEGNLTENVSIIVQSPFGPVPIELDEMYPLSQSVFPQHRDEASRRLAKRIEKTFFMHIQNYWKETPGDPGDKTRDFDIAKIRMVADMQFGKGAGTVLFPQPVTLVKSRKTGKIRSVYSDGEQLVSMGASDGLFNLRREGGRRLHQYFPFPYMRVVITDDAVPFVREGKNVFSKFVIDAAADLRPLEEVLIVDTQDSLVGVGQSLLNREELLSFKTGMGIKTRDGYTPK